MTDPPADPVMLSYDPHPVHRTMGEAIGAEFVPCRTGGLIDRMEGALSRDFGDRAVILEGGVPLTEGALSKLAGRSNTLVALAADSTYHDLVDPLPFRDRGSRIAHRLAQRYIDGTIAVSDFIAGVAERLTSGPVRVAHPFIEADRFARLGTVEPELDSREILCLGKYRPKNGQNLLLDALELVESETRVHFVGADTEKLPTGASWERHGFLEEDELIDMLPRCGLMVFPARSGAFPVATLEGLRAGLPVVVSSVVGTVTCVRPVSSRLIAEPNPSSMASAIDWYWSISGRRRRELAARSRRVGSQFDEETGIDNFVHQFRRLMEQL